MCEHCNGYGYYKEGLADMECEYCNGEGIIEEHNRDNAKEGLVLKNLNIETINKLIDKELEFARQVNPQMAMGMIQVKKILNDACNKLNTN